MNMKKTTLLLSILFIAVSISAQRISNLTIDGKISSVPFAAFNPTNNNASKPGDGQIIYPADTDFSNVAVTLNFGTVATLDAPIPWPTDWTNTVTGIKINDAVAGKWALYNVTLKAIKPSTLPLEIKTGTGNFDSDSWTKATVGWAGACIDKGQNAIRFGSSDRSFMVAFDSAPDSLYYKINALGTWEGSNNIFDIDGSIDGVSWTSIKQYNTTNIMPPASPAVIEKIKLNNPNFRYIRWIYTTRNTGGGAFNVSLENILVTKDLWTNILTTKEQGVRLYNAGTNSLRLDNSEEVKSLRIYSISGALVLEEMNPSSTITFREFDKGVYLTEIRLKSGNTIKTKFLR